MTGYLLEIGQALLALLLAPGLVGFIRMVKARLQGRRGAPPWQPYYDLRKLFGKEAVVSRNASWLFRFAPYLIFATTVAVTMLVPLVAAPLPFDAVGDLLMVVYLLPEELDAILKDFDEIVEIRLGNTILIDRLEGTGALERQTAVDHGVLGYVARASGIDVDARRDHPFAAYGELNKLPRRTPVYTSGDVYARTMIRVEEVRESVNLIRVAAGNLRTGPLVAPLGALPAFEPAFGIVEGWRGAIVHWVMADEKGRMYRVKVKDPSFVNWPALSFALLKNIVPDFPLCNKSFNQSYSGNDL